MIKQLSNYYARVGVMCVRKAPDPLIAGVTYRLTVVFIRTLLAIHFKHGK